MKSSRALIGMCFGFLMGVLFQSIVGFSFWLFFILILIAVIFSIFEIWGGSGRSFLFFILLLSCALGFFRAGTYHEDFSKEEKTFWHTSREYLVKRTKSILPQNEASLFNAMVFGYEKDVAQKIKEDFNITGTRHVLAISGMNISIIALMLMSFGLWLGLWRKQAFYVAVIAVIMFIFLVGAPASAVRAGIMGILLLWAKNKGRLVQAWRPIMLAAFFMVALNPKLLVFSIGFQLSFLAVIGIIYFKNFWARVLFWVPTKPARELVVLSMAAQTTTWPIILYNFGTLSVISPIANIFVVPLLNPIMFLGLGFVTVFWSSYLAQIFLWPVWLILKVNIKIVEFFASFSWASVNMGKSGLAILIFYPFLYLFWKYLENHGYNDPLN
ncbi:MAG: ComEC/Rec2 family competence protein [bacterium]|nr:ComEC/Rec2 family competence protein [bacterium]